ncbi:MAG: hypothetical protein JWM42_48 [Burkholderia sp.]|nr:hypothetical protein [Burkholderia sp.]
MYRFEPPRASTRKHQVESCADLPTTQFCTGVVDNNVNNYFRFTRSA